MASMPQLSGSAFCSTSVVRIHSSARAGSGALNSRFSSAQTRSAESVAMPGFQSRAGLEPVRVGPPLAVPGEEAEEAQDAEIVLADAVLGAADEAHAAGLSDRRCPPSGSSTSPATSQ